MEWIEDALATLDDAERHLKSTLKGLAPDNVIDPRRLRAQLESLPPNTLPQRDVDAALDALAALRRNSMVEFLYAGTAAIDNERAQLTEVLEAIHTFADIPPAYGAPREAEPRDERLPLLEPAYSAETADLRHVRPHQSDWEEHVHDPYREANTFYWPARMNVNSVQLAAGGDPALAAVLGMIAHTDPLALQGMVRWHDEVRAPGERRAKGATVVWLPRSDPFVVSPTLPHRPPPDVPGSSAEPWHLAGIRCLSHSSIHYGVSYLAKGYAAALSTDSPPLYLDPVSTPAPALVYEAMTNLTGHVVHWTQPRLEPSDAGLRHLLTDNHGVVACAAPLRPDDPTFERSQELRLVGNDAPAYVLTGVSDNAVQLHHPWGYDTTLTLGDFRTFFSDVVISGRR